MNALKPSMLKRLSLALAMAGSLAGCASQLDVTKKTVDETQAVKQGTQTAPFRSITGFSSSLRCMDNLMIDYGVRDVSMSRVPALTFLVWSTMSSTSMLTSRTP